MRPSFPQPNSRNMSLTDAKYLSCSCRAERHTPYFNDIIFSQLSVTARFSPYLRTVHNSVKTVLGGSSPSNVFRVNAPLSSFAAVVRRLVRTRRRFPMDFFASHSVDKARPAFLTPRPVSCFVSTERPNQTFIGFEGYHYVPKKRSGLAVKSPPLRWVSVRYPSLVMRRTPISSKLLFVAPFNNACPRVLLWHKIASALSLATGYHYVQ